MMNDTTRAPSGAKALRGMGRTLQRGDTWWIAYYFNGKEIRESAKSRNEVDARRLLKTTEGDPRQSVRRVAGGEADRRRTTRLSHYPSRNKGR